jgi:CheY-like chemotaxis protein
MSRILIVEDDAAVRKLLGKILSTEGYRVEEVASARAAIEIIRSTPPDLVITDLLMPDQDGLELIMEIRRSGTGNRIIAISGGGRIGPATYLEMADKLGADRVITKPFQPESLLRAVRELLH